MNNIAYTLDYANYRNKYNYILYEKYLVNTKIITLSLDLVIKVFSYFYHFINENRYDSIIHCSTFQLFNKDNKIIYSNSNINDEAEFFNLIEHKNGNRYLLFRIDLYGYSILDLTTMKDYHFIPEGRIQEEETFIWIKPYYNKNTNLLAVGGCYWAYPFSVFIVDFSKPENLPFPEFDIKQYLNDYEYENLYFCKWDENNNVVIKYDFYKDHKVKEIKAIIVEKEICFNMLKH